MSILIIAYKTCFSCRTFVINRISELTSVQDIIVLVLQLDERNEGSHQVSHADNEILKHPLTWRMFKIGAFLCARIGYSLS